MNLQRGKTFRYVLRENSTERYLGNMTHWVADESINSPFQVGQKIPLPDETIFSNNSKRIRNCVIFSFADTINGERVIYLNPTLEEVYFGRVDGEKLRKRDIDWSGGDGWLKL